MEFFNLITQVTIVLLACVQKFYIDRELGATPFGMRRQSSKYIPRDYGAIYKAGRSALVTVCLSLLAFMTVFMAAEWYIGYSIGIVATIVSCLFVMMLQSRNEEKFAREDKLDVKKRSRSTAYYTTSLSSVYLVFSVCWLMRYGSKIELATGYVSLILFIVSFIWNVKVFIRAFAEQEYSYQFRLNIDGVGIVEASEVYESRNKVIAVMSAPEQDVEGSEFVEYSASRVASIEVVRTLEGMD